MTNSPDESPPVPEQAEKSRNPAVIALIIAGVGCGCLGLLVLIGILAAIALPSFLSQADKARQSEAQLNVGSLARAQQAHFLEKNRFANTLAELEIGIAEESTNYAYAVVPQADPTASVYITATPKEDTLRSLSAGVFRSSDPDAIAISIICLSDEPDVEPPAMPSFDPSTNTAECPAGSSEP